MKNVFLILLSTVLFTSILSGNDKLSLLNKKNYVYFKYIEDLIKEKRMSKENIKKILNSNQRTVTKNMLVALDFDFNKKDLVKASPFYEEIITKVGNKVKNTTEAFYLADYLLRVEKYDIIDSLLDLPYCESLLDLQKETTCAYYLYISKSKQNLETKNEEMVLKKNKKLWESVKNEKFN